MLLPPQTLLGLCPVLWQCHSALAQEGFLCLSKAEQRQMCRWGSSRAPFLVHYWQPSPLLPEHMCISPSAQLQPTLVTAPQTSKQVMIKPLKLLWAWAQQTEAKKFKMQLRRGGLKKKKRNSLIPFPTIFYSLGLKLVLLPEYFLNLIYGATG